MKPFRDPFCDDILRLSSASSALSISSMVFKPPQRVSVVKSEHDSAPTISTASMTGDTSFEVSSSAADQSVVVVDSVDPQACGSGGDRGVLLHHAMKQSVRPHVAAKKHRPSKVCVKSEPPPPVFQQQPVHVGCVTDSRSQ